MKRHRVQQGECVLSLAAAYGLPWETLWNHPDNAELRAARQDPSVLAPGDVIALPDKEQKREQGATEQRHRFRKKGAAAKVRIQVKRDDVPRADEPYTLDIDGRVEKGRTDGEGMVEMRIPPRAEQGRLEIGEGDTREVHFFRLGTVDPVDTESGARGRLRCLGYDDGQSFEELLREFQHVEELSASGRLDEATKARLVERFGE